MPHCNSSATGVEIIKDGGSCPSRSPSVCIMSEPLRPSSPSVYIVTELTRSPSPIVCVVKEEVRSPSFCVTSSKRTSSPAIVDVVTECEQQPPRKVAQSPNICIVTPSSPSHQYVQRVHRDGGEATITRPVHCRRDTQVCVSACS
ncbi:hypothetical protein MRX96_047304 [Rhipicephalus microplus]